MLATRRRARRSLMGPLLLLLFAGLGDCACLKKGPPVGRQVHPDANSVARVETLKGLVFAVNDYAEALLGEEGMRFLEEPRAKLNETFGIDPLDIASWRSAGINPEGAWGMYRRGEDWILVLSIHDTSAFDASIRRFVEATEGGGSEAASKRYGRRCTAIGRQFGAEVAPSLAWCVDKTTGYVAKTIDTIDAHLSWLADGSWEKIPPVEALNGPLSLSTLATDASGQVTALSALIAPSSQGLRLSFELTDPSLDFGKIFGSARPIDVYQHLLPSPLALLAGSPASADALAALKRFSLLAPLVDALVKSGKKETGLDVEVDVLPILSGPITLSAGFAALSDRAWARLGELSKGDLERVTELRLALRHADRGALEPKIESAAAGKIGADRLAISTDEAKRKRFGIKDKNRLGWGIDDEHYYYALGKDGLTEMLTRVDSGEAAKKTSVIKSLGAANAPGATVLWVNAAAIARKLTKTLDQEQWAGLSDLSDRLGTLSLEVVPKANTLQATLEQQIQ